MRPRSDCSPTANLPRATRTKRTSLVEKRARALCVELARATGGKPLQWRMVRLIGPALGQDEAAVDAAIAHAVEQGWLLAAGSPAHSICLTDAGRVWTARFVN
jgi:hypothetical protein